MTSEAADVFPRRADGLEIHLVDDQCVVYDTASDRIHYLNPTAALVFEFCDGNHAPREIAAFLQEAYGLPAAPLDEVSGCLRSLAEMEIVR